MSQNVFEGKVGKVLPFVYYGARSLRERCIELPKELFGSDELLQLVSDMICTMETAGGVGLAGCQIGSKWRVFVLRNPVGSIDPSSNDPPASKMASLFEPVEVFINPQLMVENKEKTEWGLEGCLSIPGIQEKVERPVRVMVKAFDCYGAPFETQCVGFRARIVFHEHDHLNGMFFLDRLPVGRKRALDRSLRIIEKKYHSSR